MFENLKEMKAEEFVVAIKGKPENIGCKTAHELLFSGVSCRFGSVESFQKSLFERTGDRARIVESPIMLLNPAKIASHRKFKYALDNCPKNLRNPAQIQKSKRKEKYALTTN